MAKSDGSVIIDTRMNTDGFQSGVTNMKKGFDGIGSALGKIAKVMVGVFAVKQLVQFGKEAVALGSDLSEVQNVVDVTFEDLNGEINDFAKNAITQFGLSETAAKQYTSTMGAMLKSMGFTTREAADMGKTMTGLAADMASFYNLNAEDAFYKIRAGISGETEPLKQLGINLNVANLEQYALTQGITKSYNAMTQQEQALLRYNYLLSVTADAQGDFARTSNSWANQTRILAEQFNALKATIGQGLINVFTPVLKLLNALLARIQTVANAFKAFTELITGNKASSGGGGGVAAIPADDYSAATDGAENYAAAQEDAADATKDARKETNKYLSGLDEVRTFQEDTPTASGGASGGNSGGGDGVGSGGGGGLAVDYGNLAEGQTVVDKIAESFDKLLNLFKPMREAWAEYGDSIKSTLGKIGQDFADFGAQIAKSTYDWFSGLDWSPLLKSVDFLLQKLEPLVDLILDGLAWAYENVLLPLGQWTIEEALPATIDLFSAALSALNEIIEALKPLGNWLWENFLQPIGEWAGEKIIDALTSITNLLTKFGDWVSEHQEIVQNLAILIGSFAAAWLLLNGAITIWNVIGAVATAVTTAFGAAVAFLTSPIGIAIVIIGSLIAIGVLLYKNWDKIKEAAGKLKDWLVEKFTEIKDKVGNIVQSVKDWIVEKFTEIKEKVTNITNNIKTTLSNIWTGIKNTASNIFNGIKTSISNIWNNVKNGANNIWNSIKNSLSNIWTGIKNTVSNVFNGIKTIISNVWNAVKTGASTVWNGIKSSLSNIWNGIKSTAYSAFNSIKSNIQSVWNSIKSSASSIWNSIKNSIVNIVSSIGNSISNTVGKIKTSFINAFNGIKNALKQPINGIIAFINRMISGVVSGINAILKAFNKLNIKIPDWVPLYGGRKIGFNFSTITAPQIPYLAKGAVIPPNAPFAAVLGDQKRGNNIEAPEDLLRKIVREETGGQSINGNIELKVYLSGQQIYQEVMRIADIVRAKSGRSPYEVV